MKRPMGAPASDVLGQARRAFSVAFRGRHLLVLDATAIVISYVVSLGLRFDAPSPLFDEYLGSYAWVTPILVLIRVLTFIGAGLYQRVWRFASIAELRSIVLAVATSSVVVYGLVLVGGSMDPRLAGFPRSIAVIESLLTTALIGGMRFSFLLVGLGRQGAGSVTGARALIVGAGSAGANVARQLLGDPTLGLVPIGFADDTEPRGQRLLGLPVLGKIDDLGALVRQHGVGTVLFALPQVDGPTLRRLVRSAERANAKSLTVPSMSEVLTGQVTRAIREIGMDDLLRRAPARIDLESIRDSFAGRDIVITGAGGSIGGELSRQLVRYSPRRLVLLGRGENSIYEVVESLLASQQDGVGAETRIEPVIIDIRDRGAVRSVIWRVAPDVVFHAAAHKHVSFMESYPHEAVSNNIVGTANVVEACETGGVGRFVFVSTDKAVRPTSVMGATKRVGELIVQAAAQRSGRPFVVVRFGNVLSSRGSVVPRFRRQLAKGGPLTVTDPNVRRYFMTVGEAVQLILQATILGQRGETFVLDMGSPVLIDELARDLIELHGLTPGRDIQVVYTGLGAGEKIDEELFFPHEQAKRTLHESIWVALGGQSPDNLDLARLAAAAADQNVGAIIDGLRELVPEYVPARDRVIEYRATTFEGSEN